MSNLTVFGPLLDATVVERAVIDTLKVWLDTYLWRVEDETPGFEPRDIIRPRQWQADVDARQFPEGQLPTVIVVVGEGAPESSGDSLHMRWPLSVEVILKAPSRQRQRDLSRMYAAAIAGALLHHPELEGEILAGLSLDRVRFREVPGNPGVVAAAASVELTALQENVLRVYGGPDEPLPMPPDPDGAYPTYPDPSTVDEAIVNANPVEELP
jgi:hypothetical protein